MIRKVITTGIADLSGTADGQTMTLNRDLVNVETACAPLAVMAVHIWHCNAAGQ